MYYAQIDPTTRICVALSESSEYHPAEVLHYMIEVTSFDLDLLGKRHNETTGLFDAVAPAPVRILSHLAFANRFTQTELRAIYTAAKTNVDVEIWLDKFKIANDVELDDQSNIDGLNALEAAGLIAAGRSAAIRA